MNNRKRVIIGALLYIIGIALFILAQSAVVSGSPIDLDYLERVILCSIAVITIITAAFVCKTKSIIGKITKIIITGILIYGIIVFGGFEDNRIDSSISLATIFNRTAF